MVRRRGKRKDDKMRAKPVTRAARPVRSCKTAPKSPPPAIMAAANSQSDPKKYSATSIMNTDPKKMSSDEESLPGADRSILRSSIDTSISNLAQLAKLFENGTSELCDLLSNECSIIYECKVCRNLFRSLANFVSHKRTYCLTKYVEEMEQIMLNRKGGTINTRTTSRQDIISMLDGIIERSHHPHQAQAQNDAGRAANHNAVVLREMNSTSAGLINCNKENCLENCATLGPDGRVVESSGDSGSGYDDGAARGGSGGDSGDDETHGGSGHDGGVASPITCSVCRKRFATQRSLSEHSRAAHSDIRVCYVCPCCKKYFLNTWCVYRHLYKDHRKSNEQVRKLRTQIKRKQVTPGELIRSRNPPAKNLEEKPYDQDKAWMEELEGNMELQCCLGCGKRFDRRVALISHSQTCQKGSVTSSGGLQQARLGKRPRQQSQTGGGVPPPSPTQRPQPPPPFQRLVVDDHQEPRSGRIQVRMYYDKGHQSTDQQQLQESSGAALQSPQGQSLQHTEQSRSEEQDATVVQNDGVKQDKDVTEVVSRYRRDLDVHDKCRRLEAKLLQLHRVAVEEVEGHLTEPVAESVLSIQEVIGADPPEAVPLASLVSTTSEFEDEGEEDVSKEEDGDDDTGIILCSDDSHHQTENGTCSPVSSCTDQDVIVIDDDEDESNECIMTETFVYVNGMTDEADVTSTITIPVRDRRRVQDDADLRARIERKMDSCVDWSRKRCLICSREFGLASNAKYHVSYHLKVTNYECGTCDYRSYLREDMAQHVERLHGGGGPGDKGDPKGGTFFKRFCADEAVVDAALQEIVEKKMDDKESDQDRRRWYGSATQGTTDTGKHKQINGHAIDVTDDSQDGAETFEKRSSTPIASDSDKLRAAIMEVILGRGGSPTSGHGSTDDLEADISLPLINFGEIDDGTSDSD